MKRSLCLPLLAFVVCLLLCVASVRAGASTTFIYTEVSTTSTTAYELDSTYTDFSAVVSNHLTYHNATSAANFLIVNTTEAEKQGVMVSMKQAGAADNLKVYYKVGSTDIQLYSGEWDTNDTVKVSCSNLKLSVDLYDDSAGDYVNLLEDFAFSVDISAVAAYGSANSACDSGYANMVFGFGVGGMNIQQYIPAFISIAIVSALVGMMKKMGR